LNTNSATFYSSKFPVNKHGNLLAVHKRYHKSLEIFIFHIDMYIVENRGVRIGKSITHGLAPVLRIRSRIRIRRISTFLSHSGPFVRGMDADPDPYIIKQKY
jgi:hypothetical protein